MSLSEAVDRMAIILEGIDSDESGCDKGWWETSSGAEFGAKKLNEINNLIGEIFKGGDK